MEGLERSKITVGNDEVASLLLENYAVWHPELEKKDLCSPCNHCNDSEHCQPCGTPET